MGLTRRQINEIDNQPTIEKKFELLLVSLEEDDDKVATKEDLKLLETRLIEGTKKDLKELESRLAVKMEIHSKTLEIKLIKAMNEQITIVTDKAAANNRWLVGSLITIALVLKVAEQFHF